MEEMNKRFPKECEDGSTVFIVASDGNKVSSLFGGDDDTMRAMISFVTLKDDELRNIVGDGLLSTVTLLTPSDNGTVASA